MKFHIVLTEADADIICFKRSLPEGKFNETVLKILRAAARERVAEIPMDFEIDRSVARQHTKIDLDEGLVQRCYEKLGFKRGRFTTGVKAEIRKCIRKNLRTKNERIPIAEVEMAFENALAFTAERKAELADENYDAILDIYREGVQQLICDIEEAMRKG